MPEIGLVAHRPDANRLYLTLQSTSHIQFSNLNAKLKAQHVMKSELYKEKSGCPG